MILTRTLLVLLSISNVQTAVLSAKILGPWERGADYQSITYERSGTVVMHDCDPVAWMSFLRVQTPP